jgi:hypothetical protein
MIEQLFQASRAPFIVVRDGHLHAGTKSYGQLTVQIHEVRPVRKLFAGRTLQCWSLDCRTGKNGQLCEVCARRQRCSRRLQLRLVYRDQDQDQPAILEVPGHSFHALDQCLEQLGDLQRLPEVLVLIKPIETETGRTVLQFQLLF